jgi:hypothetical protein
MLLQVSDAVPPVFLCNTSRCTPFARKSATLLVPHCVCKLACTVPHPPPPPPVFTHVPLLTSLLVTAAGSYSLIGDGCLAAAAARLYSAFVSVLFMSLMPRHQLRRRVRHISGYNLLLFRFRFCASSCWGQRMRDDQGVGTVQEAQSWSAPLILQPQTCYDCADVLCRCCLWRGRAQEALGCCAAAVAAYRCVNDEHSLLRCKCVNYFPVLFFVKQCTGAWRRSCAS